MSKNLQSLLIQIIKFSFLPSELERNTEAEKQNDESVMPTVSPDYESQLTKKAAIINMVRHKSVKKSFAPDSSSQTC